MKIYGQIVTGGDVRTATIAHLKRWMPAMLAEVAAQSGRERGALPMFRSWNVDKTVDNWPEQQLPACVVVSSGLAATPVKHGDGSYRARWSIGVAAVVSALNQEATRELVELYTAALRAAMVQHPTLAQWDGANWVPFALGVDWLDESYDELGFMDSRTIAAGIVSLGVEVDSVVDSAAGPVVPPADATAEPGNWGIVTATEITIKEPA
jgi:hypothetical protein